jgi:hypothetical protein
MPLCFNKGPSSAEIDFSCNYHLHNVEVLPEKQFQGEGLCQKHPKPLFLDPKRIDAIEIVLPGGWKVYASSSCDIYSKVSPWQRLLMLKVARDVKFDIDKVHAS